MLALISPAKKLDVSVLDLPHTPTQPILMEEAKEIAAILKDYSESDIRKLMKLSDKLGSLNYARYQEFTSPFTPDNAKPAISVFKGDTYVGLDAETLSEDDVSYAQNHLGILSGLYGLLRPLDLMQAYRLEMGTALENKQGKNLYAFWQDKITTVCNDLIKNHDDKTVISLASNEYISSINPDKLAGDFVTCHFKEMKDGVPKVIGIHAKKARGMMARYLIQNRIEKVSDLKEFSEADYVFSADMSTESDLVFVR